MNDQASSAPMAGRGAGGGAPAQGGSPPAAARMPMGAEGVFGATNRPGEPVTAGVDWGPGTGAPPQVLEDDPYLLARALLRVAPSPQLEALVARLSR